MTCAVDDFNGSFQTGSDGATSNEEKDVKPRNELRARGGASPWKKAVAEAVQVPSECKSIRQIIRMERKAKTKASGKEKTKGSIM